MVKRNTWPVTKRKRNVHVSHLPFPSFHVYADQRFTTSNPHSEHWWTLTVGRAAGRRQSGGLTDHTSGCTSSSIPSLSKKKQHWPERDKTVTMCTVKEGAASYCHWTTPCLFLNSQFAERPQKTVVVFRCDTNQIWLDIGRRLHTLQSWQNKTTELDKESQVTSLKSHVHFSSPVTLFQPVPWWMCNTCDECSTPKVSPPPHFCMALPHPHPSFPHLNVFFHILIIIFVYVQIFLPRKCPTPRCVQCFYIWHFLYISQSCLRLPRVSAQQLHKWSIKTTDHEYSIWICLCLRVNEGSSVIYLKPPDPTRQTHKIPQLSAVTHIRMRCRHSL